MKKKCRSIGEIEIEKKGERYIMKKKSQTLQDRKIHMYLTNTFTKHTPKKCATSEEYQNKKKNENKIIAIY